MMRSSLHSTILIALIWGGVAGCDSAIDRFPANRLYALVAAKRDMSDTPVELTPIEIAVTVRFGTPDAPIVPAAFSAILDETVLRRAAGPQYSDQDDRHFGLFREHCATCHGVDGGGRGPAAALLSPYPRDFRPGVFKWKSTARPEKPLAADLTALLQRGIPGTAMPSFATVKDEDLVAIVQYIIYLSARGQTERALIDMASQDDVGENQWAMFADEAVSDVAQQWIVAVDHVVSVPPVPVAIGDVAWWQDAATIARGEKLFHGPLANCVSCHGKSGDGEAVTLDFDDWTKEYSTKLGLSPSDAAEMRVMQKAGAPAAYPIVPRKLRWGVFHGNDTDDALYRRLVTGIAGSPMPGLLLNEGESTVGIDPGDVWAIIAYVRSLGGGV